MITIEGDKTIYIDVDQTLALWPFFCKANGLESKWKEASISVGVDGFAMDVLPNTVLIEFLYGLKAQGCKLIVWSHGGYRWAEAIVKAFGIENLIDVVMCKPTMMLDDKTIDHLGHTSMPTYPKGDMS